MQSDERVRCAGMPAVPVVVAAATLITAVTSCSGRLTSTEGTASGASGASLGASVPAGGIGRAHLGWVIDRRGCVRASARLPGLDDADGTGRARRRDRVLGQSAASADNAHHTHRAHSHDVQRGLRILAVGRL